MKNLTERDFLVTWLVYCFDFMYRSFLIYSETLGDCFSGSPGRMLNPKKTGGGGSIWPPMWLFLNWNSSCHLEDMKTFINSSYFCSSGFSFIFPSCLYYPVTALSEIICLINLTICWFLKILKYHSNDKSIVFYCWSLLL